MTLRKPKGLLRLAAVFLIVTAAVALFLLKRSTSVIPIGPSQLELREPPGLTVTVQDVRDGQFYLSFKNEAGMEYLFGWGCELEKQVDGQWYALKNHKEGKIAVTAEAFLVQPKETLLWEETVDWYGDPLSPGRYRVIKEVFSRDTPEEPFQFYDAAAELEIER